MLFLHSETLVKEDTEMRNLKLTCLILFALSCISGCSASVLFPPLPGPMIIPSSISSAYTAYSISTDERGFQTIVEDEMLETSIQSAILKEKGLNVLDLSTYVYNGHVYVIGTYDEQEDFKRIRKVVKSKDKVNSLTTYLFKEDDSSICNSAEDYLLQLAVKGALLEGESIWGANYAVKSVQCNIVLLGRVGDINEAVAARQIAEQVSGVRSVKTFIRSRQRNRYFRQYDRIAATLP